MLNRNILKLVLLFGDVFLLYASLFLAEAVRHGVFALQLTQNFKILFFHFTIIYFFWLLLLYIFDFYEFVEKDNADTIRNFITLVILALSAGVFYFYLRPDVGIAPKTILLLDVIIFGVLMLIWRTLFGRIFNIRYNGTVVQAEKTVSLKDIDDEKFLKNFSYSKKYEAAKIRIDFLSGLIGLFLFIILFLLIALAIKLTSPGPIFYTQKRVGQRGRIFTLFKFRTMVQDAEKKGPQWTQEKDVRIIKVGYFLRRTHLDELPQAINLLRGEISLIGPRPERPEFVTILEKEIPHYKLRELVRPGILGWAQLNFPYGDSIEDAREKLKYDLYYIQNRSLFLDLAIILKSLKIIIFAKGQ